MIKKMFLFLMTAMMLASCGSSPEQAKTEVVEVVKISVDDFWNNPGTFVGQEVMIEGVVLHVCQHGGKRMFIAGSDPDERLQIRPGDDMQPFSVKMEGSFLEIRGIVDELRIDEPYLVSWENELIADNPDSELKIHRGEEGHEHHHDDEDHEYEWRQIKRYRELIAESGDDHLSFYSVIAGSFVEK
jgi:hypothetical protein